MSKQCLRQNLLLVVGYIYNFMSTQAEEEGVEGVDDALIDSLIEDHVSNGYL